MHKAKLFLPLLMVSIILATGCQDRQDEPEMEAEIETDNEAIEVNKEEKEERSQLEVELMDQEGIQVGMATLTEETDGVHIKVEANHLPAGEHGFHIHEKGICEEPSFESAGGHFNPDNKKHGFKNPEGPHAGDIENLEVMEDGTVEQTFVNDRVTLEKGKPNSLFNEEGTSLIIHSDPDDYVSQPAGNAGERIVCGVIAEKEK